ncbi:hypothetical protein DAPPUDRAFT_306953 [Daphnia pulex]|uniref:Uncharacterized protein n=1 Tax=Daphnia pulex TaxID=6669 RepID=E9H0A8_DAPPU|nr:hypothetical protein DAPPUDRAFT_306953 [Daphnia pulex]|eukprot:EFX74772.1 hypothetical protein DAPPUDRAFT_306953 [Daphnia pulex]
MCYIIYVYQVDETSCWNSESRLLIVTCKYLTKSRHLFQSSESFAHLLSKIVNNKNEP